MIARHAWQRVGGVTQIGWNFGDRTQGAMPIYDLGLKVSGVPSDKGIWGVFSSIVETCFW